jgi:hypothetical protein
MSFSIPPTSPVSSYAPQSPLGSALSSTMDIASTLMQFSTGLLQNLVQAQQSQFGGLPGAGAPGLGAPGLGAPGLGGPQGAGQGLQGILQGVVQLLQALTPLLQALGGGGLGGLGTANPLANSVASQLGGGLGGGLGAGLGGGLGGLGGGIPAYPQPFAQQPSVASPYTQSFAQQPFTAFQQPYAGGTASPYNASFAQTPFTSLNQPFTQTDALNWAQTFGGPNLSQKELTQGVNLFNIFNGRTTGMLF